MNVWCSGSYGNRFVSTRERAEICVRDAISEAQRLLVPHELEVLPFDRQAPIASQIQTRRQDLADALLLRGHERRVHHALWRDAQLVGHVDDVNDERAFDAAILEHDIEVAERRGMSPRDAHAAARQDRRR